MFSGACNQEPSGSDVRIELPSEPLTPARQVFQEPPTVTEPETTPSDNNQRITRVAVTYAQTLLSDALKDAQQALTSDEYSTLKQLLGGQFFAQKILQPEPTLTQSDVLNALAWADIPVTVRPLIEALIENNTATIATFYREHDLGSRWLQDIVDLPPAEYLQQQLSKLETQLTTLDARFPFARTANENLLWDLAVFAQGIPDKRPFFDEDHRKENGFPSYLPLWRIHFDSKALVSFVTFIDPMMPSNDTTNLRQSIFFAFELIWYKDSFPENVRCLLEAYQQQHRLGVFMGSRRQLTQLQDSLATAFIQWAADTNKEGLRRMIYHGWVVDEDVSDVPTRQWLIRQIQETRLDLKKRATLSGKLQSMSMGYATNERTVVPPDWDQWQPVVRLAYQLECVVAGQAALKSADQLSAAHMTMRTKIDECSAIIRESSDAPEQTPWAAFIANCNQRSKQCLSPDEMNRLQQKIDCLRESLGTIDDSQALYEHCNTIKTLQQKLSAQTRNAPHDDPSMQQQLQKMAAALNQLCLAAIVTADPKLSKLPGKIESLRDDLLPMEFAPAHDSDDQSNFRYALERYEQQINLELIPELINGQLRSINFDSDLYTEYVSAGGQATVFQITKVKGTSEVQVPYATLHDLLKAHQVAIDPVSLVDVRPILTQALADDQRFNELAQRTIDDTQPVWAFWLPKPKMLSTDSWMSIIRRYCTAVSTPDFTLDSVTENDTSVSQNDVSAT